MHLAHQFFLNVQFKHDSKIHNHLTFFNTKNENNKSQGQLRLT